MFKRAERGSAGMVETVETRDGRMMDRPEAVELIKSSLLQDVSGEGRRGRQFTHSYLEWLADGSNQPADES